MKLPSLPKPTKGARKVPQVRVPGAVEDLYRDMRDRRLIVPALALIVAIVAVPMALSADKEPPPAPVAYTAPEGSEAVAPAVLAEQPVGVRDYRERLKELKSKNPFAGNFDSAQGAGGGEGSESTVDLTAPGASSVPDIPTNNDVVPTDTPTPATTTPPADDTGDDAGGSGNGVDELLILAPRIDVRAGLVGERDKFKSVESGDLLPNKRRAPIVMLLGASENLKYAHFAVSDGVADTEGDGICRPDRHRCEFLRLKEDEKQYFTYGPDGDRYSLKVTDIREEIVDRRKVDGA
jgi:hypothetical protein